MSETLEIYNLFSQECPGLTSAALTLHVFQRQEKQQFLEKMGEHADSTYKDPKWVWTQDERQAIV